MQTTTANAIYEDHRLSPDLPVAEATRHEIRHRYPASAFQGPLFEGRDRVALVMATVMLIGPLVALPLGMG